MKSVQKRLEAGELLDFEEWERAVNEEIGKCVLAYTCSPARPSQRAVEKYKGGLWRRYLRERHAIRPHTATESFKRITT